MIESFGVRVTGRMLLRDPHHNHCQSLRAMVGVGQRWRIPSGPSIVIGISIKKQSRNNCTRGDDVHHNRRNHVQQCPKNGVPTTVNELQN
jgi:hypothetical protein